MSPLAQPMQEHLENDVDGNVLEEAVTMKLKFHFAADDEMNDRCRSPPLSADSVRP